jgi:hypothetical protein
MLRKVVARRSQHADSTAEDLAWWLGRPAAERIAAVEFLRRQVHGSTTRLRRVARVVQRARLPSVRST